MLKRAPISYATIGTSKVLEVNHRAVLANKCSGGSHASLQMLCGMLNLPAPVSQNVYTKHSKAVRDQCILQAEASMTSAREEVREHHGVESDEVADILVSCDGTWQKRGFSSLFGAVFVIAHETGKVVDYTVLSKFCKGCRYWEAKDHTSDAYQQWKAKHECDTNFVGSAGAMEPRGSLESFHGLQGSFQVSHL